MSGARTPRALLAPAAVLLAPLALRSLLVWERTAGPAPADLRGALSDAGAALLALALLAALARLSRGLALAASLPWVALHYANYENVRALDALVSPHDWGFLADPTFLQGSALAVSRPLLLGALVVATAALLWTGLAGGRRSGPPLLAAALLLGIHALWPPHEAAPTWRQAHFLPYHARRALVPDAGAPEAPRDFPDPPTALLDWSPDLAADLSGTPRLPEAGRARNVLLVILEGVSGAHVASLAEDHGRFVAGPPLLPNLDSFALAHLSWSTFLTHQRKTNRGLYALLCGELPNLVPGLPKMSEFVERGWRTCLPELLRDAGYHTAFLQAAPLAFMMKDQFMPKIGFEETHGQEWFRSHYARSKWGIDDRAFLEQSVGLVERLAREPGPWLLTLLTVGTHHPFVVPDDFLPERRSDALRALRYLDVAFGVFVERLRERRLLDDTLLLVTSDESLGLHAGAGPVTRILSQNWGLLLAATPDSHSERVSAPFAQVDLALSVLDYLGLAERGRHLFGRSVFRSYERGRPIFFANTNLLSAGVLGADGALLLCRDDYRRCERWALPSGRLFGPGRVRRGPDPEGERFLRELARRSRHAHPGGDAPREFALLADPHFTTDAAHDQLVHGGQYVDLRPGEWLEVEIEVSARSPDGATARLVHLLWATGSPPLHQSATRLSDGETLRLHYTFAPSRPRDGVRCRTLASTERGAATLHFSRARMRIHVDGPPPPPGVHVRTLEVVAAGATGAVPDTAPRPDAGS